MARLGSGAIPCLAHGMPSRAAERSVALRRRPAKVQPAKALSRGERGAAGCKHRSAAREKANTIPTRDISCEPSSQGLRSSRRRCAPRTSMCSHRGVLTAAEWKLRKPCRDAGCKPHSVWGIASLRRRHDRCVRPQPQQAWRQGHLRGTDTDILTLFTRAAGSVADTCWILLQQREHGAVPPDSVCTAQPDIPGQRSRIRPVIVWPGGKLPADPPGVCAVFFGTHSVSETGKELGVFSKNLWTSELLKAN